MSTKEKIPGIFIAIAIFLVGVCAFIVSADTHVPSTTKMNTVVGNVSNRLSHVSSISVGGAFTGLSTTARVIITNNYTGVSSANPAIHGTTKKGNSPGVTGTGMNIGVRGYGTGAGGSRGVYGYSLAGYGVLGEGGTYGGYFQGGGGLYGSTVVSGDGKFNGYIPQDAATADATTRNLHKRVSSGYWPEYTNGTFNTATTILQPMVTTDNLVGNWKVMRNITGIFHNTNFTGTIRTPHLLHVSGKYVRVGFMGCYSTANRAGMTVHSAYMGFWNHTGWYSNAPITQNTRLTFAGSTSMNVPDKQVRYSDWLPWTVTKNDIAMVTGYYTNMVGSKNYENEAQYESGNVASVTRRLAVTGGYDGGGDAWNAFAIEVLTDGPPSMNSILLLGESNMIGVSVTRKTGNSFAARLGEVYDLYNAGHGGNLTKWESAHFRQRMRPGYMPQTAFMCWGLNDGNSFTGQGWPTLQDSKLNILKMVHECKSLGMKLVLISPFVQINDTTVAQNYRRDLANWERSLVAEGQADGYIDFEQAFRVGSSNPPFPNSNYLASDGLHQNDAGGRVMFNATTDPTYSLSSFNFLMQETLDVNIYVDKASGYDVSGYGFSAATPVKSIDYALTLLRRGEHKTNAIVNLGFGTYSTATINPLGVNYASLTLRGTYAVNKTVHTTSWSSARTFATSDALPTLGDIGYITSATTGAGQYQVYRTTNTLGSGYSPTPSNDAVIEFRQPTTVIDFKGAADGVLLQDTPNLTFEWCKLQNAAAVVHNKSPYTPQFNYCQIVPASGGYGIYSAESNGRSSPTSVGVAACFLSGGSNATYGNVSMENSLVYGCGSHGVLTNRTNQLAWMVRTGIYNCAGDAIHADAGYVQVNQPGTSWIGNNTGWGAKLADGAVNSGVATANYESNTAGDRNMKLAGATTVSVSSGTTTLDPTTGNWFLLSNSGLAGTTLNMAANTACPAGTVIDIVPYNNETITFGTGFKASGTASASSGYILPVKFTYDGTYWRESGREATSYAY